MNPFHLNRLPSVALSEVFKNFIFLDLFDLSRVSRRMATLINRYGKERKRILDVSICSRDGEIRIKPGHDSKYDEIYAYSITDPYSESYSASSYDLYVSCVDHIFEILSILANLVNVFACSIKSLEVYGLKKTWTRAVSNWIREHDNVVFESVFLSDRNLEHLKILEYLLENRRITDCFSIILRVNPQFNYTLKNVTQRFCIHNAEWMKMSNLLELNFKIGELYETLFTNEDVNCLIEKWKSGGLPNLKFLEFHSKNLNNESPIDGIIPPIIQEDQRNRPRIEIAMFPFFAGIGTEIVREDGVRANMYVNTTRDPPEFSLYVFD